MVLPRGKYKIGPPARPVITHDNGFLDRYARRDPTAGDRARQLLWMAIIEAAEAGQGFPMLPHNDIPDALAAYRHFLEGNGVARQINYERFLANDPVGETYTLSFIREVKAAVIDLYTSRPARERSAFSFTGSALPAGSDRLRGYPYPQTENWQKAIGAHFFWMCGDAEVEHLDGRDPRFIVSFNIHVEDMYNFNPGQQDVATGIPDAMNGELALAGLGHQYLNQATITREIEWTGVSRAAQGTLMDGPPAGRQRAPQNNRRARNRI